jgi:hypothetical protein
VRKPLTVIASDLRSADESTVKLSYPRHLVSANNLTVLGPSVSDKSACCGDKEGCYVCNITSASQICAMQYHQDSYCGNSADISVSVIKTSCCGNYSAEACVACQLNVPVIYCSPTTGSTIIWGFGKDFGNVVLSLTAKVGPTACAISQWLSATSLMCKSQQGLSRLIPFSVTIGLTGESIAESVTKVFSYSLPRDFNISQFSGNQSLAKTGCFIVAVQGYGFGSFRSTSAFRLALSSAEVSFWRSETIMSLKAGFSHSKIVSLQFSIGLQNIGIETLFAMSNFSIFHNFTIFNASREVIPTSGSAIVQIVGANFATSGYSVLSSRMGRSLPSSTMWRSDSATRLKSPSGVDQAMTVVVTQLMLLREIPQLVTYIKQSVSAVWLSSDMLIPQTGGISVSVLGLNFGVVRYSKISGRIGGSSLFSTTWISDSTTRLKCPTGISRGLDVVLTHSMFLSTTTQVIGYVPPNASSVKSYAGFLLARSGSWSITLWGSNFGTRRRSPIGRIGPSFPVATRWIADTMTSLKAMAGVSRSMRVALTQVQQVSTLSELMSFTYYSAKGVAFNALPASGSALLEFLGRSFAVTDASLLASKVGDSFSEGTKWISDSATCLKIQSGFVRNANVLLTQGLQIRTVFYDTSYVLASISNVRESEMPSTGRFSVQVLGFNFAKIGVSQAIRAGDSAPDVSFWSSDSCMNLKMGQGAGLNRVFISINQQMWSMNTFFSYSVLQHIHSFRPVNAPSTGATSSTINGAMFGVTDMTMSFRFGGTVAEAVIWNSDSYVVLKTPSCLDRNPSLTVSVLVQTITFANVSVFDKPEAPITAAVSPTNSATTSNTMLTMSGSGLGKADRSPAIRLLESGVTFTRWRSESSVRCRMPGGTSSLLTLTFTLITLLLDRVSRTFSYDINAKQLLGSTLTQQPNSGSSWILIALSNLGRYDTSPSSLL